MLRSETRCVQLSRWHWRWLVLMATPQATHSISPPATPAVDPELAYDPEAVVKMLDALKQKLVDPAQIQPKDDLLLSTKARLDAVHL